MNNQPQNPVLISITHAPEGTQPSEFINLLQSAAPELFKEQDSSEIDFLILDIYLFRFAANLQFLYKRSQNYLEFFHYSTLEEEEEERPHQVSDRAPEQKQSRQNRFLKL